MAGAYEHDNEHSGSIRCGQFFLDLIASQEGLCSVELEV
jgi:hypothetical protein